MKKTRREMMFAILIVIPSIILIAYLYMDLLEILSMSNYQIGAKL